MIGLGLLGVRIRTKLPRSMNIDVKLPANGAYQVSITMSH
jgi:hypothetical protein